jgi:phage terminase small subunit
MNALATRQLTDRQADFVRFHGQGMNATQAAIACGYPESSAAQRGYELLHMPHVLAAVHTTARRRLVSDAPNSIRVLQTLRDTAVSEKVRADAARTLLDRAGHIAPRAAAPDGKRDLSLHEMSLADLRDLADKLEGELAGRAREVSAPLAPFAEAPTVDALA